MKQAYLFTILIFLATTLLVGAQETLKFGHSHNDYLAERPLYSALQQGYFSVEADVWSEKDGFMVAHYRKEVGVGKTLEKLYLIPLKAIINQNNGSVYGDGRLGFTLMIDLKGEWTNADLRNLEDFLEPWNDLLSTWSDSGFSEGAVEILLSGDEIRYNALDYKPRRFTIDGRWGDLESDYDFSQVPRISENYKSHFSWKGKGEQPEEERRLLKEMVSEVHADGREIRFWGTPDKPQVWEALLDAGVDWVNVDDLEGFRKFLSEREKNTE